MRAIQLSCFLLFVLLRLVATGQVIITPNQLPTGTISLDRSFSVQLNNTQPFTISGFLSVKYSQNGKPLAEIAYQQIQLNQGNQNYNTADLAKTGERITDDKLRKSRVLKTGEVLMCIEFINSADNTVAGSQCNTIVLSGSEDSTSNTPNNKFKLPVTFTGYAEVSGSYSNRQGSFQEMPANYTNVIVNPQLEVLGIPMGARFNYSTASDKKQQNMNLFTVYLDAEKLREKMNKKYITNAAKDYVLENSELGDYKQKTAEFNKLSAILNNPYVKGELAKLVKLDSLDKLIQDSSSYLSSSRLSDLKSQRDSLSYLEGKREGYSSLVQKQKKLATVLDIYNNPMETDVLKDSLELLAKKLENTRNPFSDDDEKKLSELDSLLDDNKITKQRREILKKQRDGLSERKKSKQEYEDLKEQYANLHHTYEYKSKLDSLRGHRKDASSLLKKDSLKNAFTADGANNLKDKFSFLKSIKSLNIGFFAPQTGELTMNGVPIRGAGTEVQLGKFFVNVAGGKLQRATQPGTLNNSPTPFSRSVYSATVGVGSAAGSFFSVQYIDAKDKITDPVAGTTADFFNSKSGYNQVLATKFRASLFKNKTIIEGEAAGSQLTNTNTLIGETGATKVYTANKWLTNLKNQSNGDDFRTGYAYNIAVKQFMNKGRTQLSLSSKKTMSSYVSFGSPFLLSDVYINEAKLTQQLWQGKVMVSGFYRINTDNLDNLKVYTTTSKNFGGDVSVRVPKWPSLRVAYMPVMQQTPGNYFNTDMLMANSVYGLRKGIYYHQWSGVYLNQKSSSRVGYNNFSSQSYTISYLLSIKQKFNVNINGNYIDQKSTVLVKGYTGNISVGYMHKNKIGQSLGTAISDNSVGNRLTWFYELTANLNTHFSLRARYDNTNYTSTNIYPLDVGYKENLVVFSLISKW